MKINLTDKMQQIANHPAQVSPKSPDTKAFNSVLQDTLEKSKETDLGNCQPIASLRHSHAGMEILSTTGVTETAVAHRLLDTLENYQKQLADPAFSLKMIQPSLDQLSIQNGHSKKIMEKMPDGNPIKEILQETTTKISQEIEKFNAGYYVDA